QVVGGGGGASPDGLHQPPERSCERLGGTVAREGGGDHEVDEHAARGGQCVLGEGGAGRGGARSDRERDVEEGRLVEGDGLVDLTLRCSWLHSPLRPSRSGGRRRAPPPAAPRAWTPSALARAAWRASGGPGSCRGVPPMRRRSGTRAPPHPSPGRRRWRLGSGGRCRA